MVSAANAWAACGGCCDSKSEETVAVNSVKTETSCCSAKAMEKTAKVEKTCCSGQTAKADALKQAQKNVKTGQKGATLLARL